jgi:hypothetical protein
MLSRRPGAFSIKEFHMSHYKLIAAAVFAAALGTSAGAQTDNSASQPSTPTTTTAPAPQQPDQGATQSGQTSGQPSSGDTTSQQPQQGQDSSAPQPH